MAHGPTCGHRRRGHDFWTDVRHECRHRRHVCRCTEWPLVKLSKIDCATCHWPWHSVQTVFFYKLDISSPFVCQVLKKKKTLISRTYVDITLVDGRNTSAWYFHCWRCLVVLLYTGYWCQTFCFTPLHSYMVSFVLFWLYDSAWRWTVCVFVLRWCNSDLLDLLCAACRLILPQHCCKKP